MQSIVWLRRLVYEYGSSPPISLDLCVDDEDPSQLIIRPEWDAPLVRCSPRTFCAWPCLLRQVGTVLGSPYDCVVARLAYANPGSRQDEFANFIRNQSLSNGIELDPRFHSRAEDPSQTFQISRRRRHAGSSKLTDKEQLEGPCTIHCFEDSRV